MGPWTEIAKQSRWWVPLAGWDQWREWPRLGLLPRNDHRLAVSEMSQEHRVRAGTLLVRQLITERWVASVLTSEFDSAALKAECSSIEAFTAVASTPLALALCDQPSLLTPLLEHPLVLKMFSQAASLDPHVRQPCEFELMNDALAGVLLKDAAQIVSGMLLSDLTRQGVMLPEALQLSLELSTCG